MDIETLKSTVSSMVNFVDPEDAETVTGMAEFVLAGIHSLQSKLTTLEAENERLEKEEKRSLRNLKMANDLIAEYREANTKLQEQNAELRGEVKVYREALGHDLVNKYLEDYELRDDNACYTPNDFEKTLILDFVMGLHDYAEQALNQDTEKAGRCKVCNIRLAIQDDKCESCNESTEGKE